MREHRSIFLIKRLQLRVTRISSASVSTRRVQRTASPMAQTVRPPRIIPWRELSGMVPFTRQHVLRLEKVGKFPKRLKVGNRRIGWLETEIETWINDCPRGR